MVGISPDLSTDTELSSQILCIGMKNMERREGVHPSHARALDTQGLRQEYLVEKMFIPNVCKTIYCVSDRLIFGGVMPIEEAVTVPDEVSAPLGTRHFLERREMGLLNIGGEGTVKVDGEQFTLANMDGLYVGSGARELLFCSADASHPAKFYFVSGLAHTSHPTRLLHSSGARDVVRGSSLSCGKRRILTYIAPDIIPSCQLVMGVTKLVEGTLWNTMPPHTHINRSEVFMYYGMEPDTAVIHLMGEPRETRHLVVRDEQAVIVPGWSIHSGVGTGSYSLVWATVGENQEIMNFDLAPAASLA
jgi:4-deoxy-L-threo-5-hexosulose-uronate ketol-isomerase